MGGLRSLAHDLAGYRSIMVDTMIFVYVLTRHPRYFSLAKRVLLGIESGQHQGLISTVTLAELLTTVTIPFHSKAKTTKDTKDTKAQRER